MVYGKEKLREMARSILPSSHRKGSRERKALCKRNARREVRQSLGRAFRDAEDDEVSDRVNTRYWPNHKINWLVRERQQGDKINHFVRWAVAYTSDLEPDARLARMKRVLPNNLIGWHARSHLEFREEFSKDNFRFTRYWLRRSPPLPHDRIVSILRSVVEDANLFALLNNSLRQSHRRVLWILGYEAPRVTEKVEYHWGANPRRIWHVELPPKTVKKGPDARVLKGTFDIEPFLEDLANASKGPSKIRSPLWVEKKIVTQTNQDEKLVHWSISENRQKSRQNPDYHPEWLTVLTNFLKAYVETGGFYDEMRRKNFEPVSRSW